MSDSKKPVSKIQMYPITAAIWRNQNAKGDVFFNITFERSFKDEGGYQSSNSYSAADALLLAKVADLAHSEVYRLRSTERQAQSSDE